MRQVPDSQFLGSVTWSICTGERVKNEMSQELELDAIVRGTQVNVDDTLVGGWMRKESSEQALYVFF